LRDAGGYDAVVIGAGHNGLVCAAYLASEGLRVVVLERSDRIGGACVTEELFPGFRFSTAAYSLSLLQPDIVSDLSLKLEIRGKDPSVFAPFEEGGGLLLWEKEADKRRNEIAKVSKADADAYPRFLELFDEAARRFRPFLTYPATRKQVRRGFRASEVEGLFKKTVDAPIAEVCEEFFESDLMRGLMASQGIIGSSAGPRTPGTSYLYLHHAFGEIAGRSGGWGLVRGGMGAVTAQLADAVRTAGGDIRLSSEVAAIKLDGHRRAGGVSLASGEEIDAPVVVSNADPKRTVALVSRDVLPPEFVQDVELIPTEGTVVKVNCALSGLPRFPGMSTNGVGPEHLATITVSPSIDYLEKACRAAAEGRVPDAMFLEAWIQTASEPELAPDGKHTLSVFAQYVPYSLGEGTWDERREEIGDVVIGSLERYAPGLSDLVEDRLVLGPPDLEARFGLTGGHIFHGELLPEWLFEKRPASGWHRHRTPLPGLYLCGSGTHPGGGVCGAPGRNAARAVMADVVAAGGTLPLFG
jgi:phytoene dehydrogenase-like protein